MGQVTHGTAARNAICEAVRTTLNTGTTNTYAKVVLTTSADAVISEHDLSDPPLGTPANGIATETGVESNAGATAGLAAKCKFYDKDDNLQLEGTVTEEGEYPVDDPLEGAVVLASKNVTNGETVVLTSVSYEAPA